MPKDAPSIGCTLFCVFLQASPHPTSRPFHHPTSLKSPLHNVHLVNSILLFPFHFKFGFCRIGFSEASDQVRALTPSQMPQCHGHMADGTFIHSGHLMTVSPLGCQFQEPRHWVYLLFFCVTPTPVTVSCPVGAQYIFIERLKVEIKIHPFSITFFLI